MQLVFSESKGFYKQLDQAVKRGAVAIRFVSERPDINSKLWPRLKQCENWKLVEEEIKKHMSGEHSELDRIIKPNMTASLGGAEIALIAWIALLVAGVLFYGIYKGRQVKFKTSTPYGDGEIEIV
ncbi:MAG TPA: hypothetical protein DF774_05210 [Rheinheimera sp.]|uniref:hypothetical protein n=1 Tax=Rheinheimera sp. TaxID=1869214 RepID=UPI000ECCF92F|nr:hypothetical protein [Rheinheimera sp.]HCU65143.1 hypothetical protein [Rheinheimera sp.]